MNENLQSNPFFSALTDHIPNLERSCVEKGWIICVPQTASLPESHRISLRLLKMHVLIPSSDPTVFNTLNSTVTVKRTNDKDLEVQNGTTSISTLSILYRESIYCGARGNESYVAFCVSRPLDGYGTVPLLNDGSEAFAENRSAEEWESLLFTDSFTRKELQMFESKTASLESPLDGKKEPAAYTEIRNFAERMCKQNFDPQFEAARTNQKFGIILQTAYETTATFACHGILFASLCQRHASNEKALQIRLHDMRSQVIEQRCPVDRAGLTKEFLERFDLRNSDIFAKATERLQRLNESKSPLEKLWCVQEANRALREIPGNDNMDDSLPLFLLCLVNAAPGLLLANLAFMSDFAPRQWVKNAGELAFHCTVFSGAILLIQEHVPQVVDDGDRSLLRNLIVAGGSGLSAGGWSNSNSGHNNSKLSSNVNGAFSPLKWFEGCAPQFRT